MFIPTKTSHLVRPSRWYCCRDFLAAENQGEPIPRFAHPIAAREYSQFIHASLNHEVYSTYAGLPTTQPDAFIGIRSERLEDMTFQQFYFGQDKEHLSYHEVIEPDLRDKPNLKKVYIYGDCLTCNIEYVVHVWVQGE